MSVWRSRQGRSLLCHRYGRDQVGCHLFSQGRVCRHLSFDLKFKLIVLKTLSRGCAGTGTIMTAHNSIFMGPIKVGASFHPGVSPSPFQVYGSEQQKMDILPSFVTGEKVGSCTSLVEVRDDIYRDTSPFYTYIENR